MFCQNCGVAEQSPKSYCKRCGEWLPERGMSRGRNSPEERLHAMMIFSGLNAVFALFGSIALYATYLGKPDAKWSVYFAAAFCLVITVHQTVSFFFAMELHQRVRRGRGESTEVNENQIQSSLKEGEAEQFEVARSRSVAEKTTELLSPLNASIKSRKERLF